jgi:hypothetical protein
MGPLSNGDTTFYMKMMPALVISNEIYSSLSHFVPLLSARGKNSYEIVLVSPQQCSEYCHH